MGLLMSQGTASMSRTWSAPMFPLSVHGFAGRRAELDRIGARIDDDVLFVVYGLGGIGKSELVYRAIQELRQRERWRDAVPILVEVRPGVSVTLVLNQLLAAVGAGVEPRRGRDTEEDHLREQLDALAVRLEEGRYLVFLDDVHHLPAAPVAAVLRHLSRRVRRSRIFAASREEIPLPADAPPPVVTTLGPLDRAAAIELANELAGRLQAPRPDPDRILRATHGSPFHIRQMMVCPAPARDPLEDSLGALSPPARRLLLAAAVARQPLPADLAPEVDADGPAAAGEALRELGQRFLLDGERGRLGVHDLIRDALLDRVGPEELTAAHEQAARLCLAELERRGTSRGGLVVDAVGHLIAAGRHTAAWDLVERWQSTLAAAGSEHLLLEPIDRLRAALPERRVAIDLFVARCLVRASRFEEAAGVVAGIEPDSPEDRARHHLLAGEIARRTGDLEAASAELARAVACAPDDSLRFHARLQQATAAMFEGDGAGARAIVDAALSELDSPSPRQRARCAWARAASWMFEERFERAATEARRAREELGNELADLGNRLAMIETLACIEGDDMAGARATARLIDAAGVRRRVASLYRSIACYADGQARLAIPGLREAHEYLSEHGDTLNAHLAAYYGSAALAEVGSIGEAAVLAERAWALAREAGIPALAAQARAQQALIVADAMQSALAHRLADEALSTPGIGPRSRVRAHCAHAHAYNLEGNITAAQQQIALAQVAVLDPEMEAAQATVDVEQAAVDLIGGNLERSVEYAERAVSHYSVRSRDYEGARTGLVLAAAYIARGRRSDLLLAERCIVQALELADRAELHSIQVGCAILSAALARRANRERAAEEVLADALRRLDPERGSLFAGLLAAAIEGGAVARAMPGVVALLAHLGFADSIDSYLVDEHGRRAATDEDVARERELRDIFVDEVRSVIVAGRAGGEIRGRPMQCALLSVLVQARGEPVPADVLYKRVWNVGEYHPLQHRNALYVAINRLRKSLRQAIPDREVIERTGNGWRLADGIDACVAIAVRDPEKTM